MFARPNIRSIAIGLVLATAFANGCSRPAASSVQATALPVAASVASVTVTPAQVADARTALMSTKPDLTLRGEEVPPLLHRGELVAASGGAYVLHFQNDGDLVLLGLGANGIFDQEIWSVRAKDRIGGEPPDTLFLSQNAGLFLFAGHQSIAHKADGVAALLDDANKHKVWDSGSELDTMSEFVRCHGAALTVADDGELIVTCGKYIVVSGDIAAAVRWTSGKGLATHFLRFVPPSTAALYDEYTWSISD